jgi:hypothetical protein
VSPVGEQVTEILRGILAGIVLAFLSGRPAGGFRR